MGGCPVGGVLAVCEYDPTIGRGEIYFQVVNGRLFRDQEMGKPPANFLAVACGKLARLLANEALIATTDCDPADVRLGGAPFAGGLRRERILVAFSGGPSALDRKIAEQVIETAVELELASQS